MRLAETPCGSLSKRRISSDRQLDAPAASTTD
jgi:hypothetical protein